MPLPNDVAGMMGPSDPANHPVDNLPGGDNYMGIDHMVNPENDAFKGMRNHTKTQTRGHKGLKHKPSGHLIRKKGN